MRALHHSFFSGIAQLIISCSTHPQCTLKAITLCSLTKALIFRERRHGIPGQGGPLAIFSPALDGLASILREMFWTNRVGVAMRPLMGVGMGGSAIPFTPISTTSVRSSVGVS